MNRSTTRSRKKSKDTFKQMKMNTTTQNLWNTGKAILRGKFIALQAYLKKQEKTQINHLTSHLKVLEKEQQTKPKVSRQKEILKIRVEMNKINYKKYKRSMKPRAGSSKR